MSYVYLIESSKKRTYIGSTKNPERRLRQHNGEVKGGAHKTTKGRPWRMIVLISGFKKFTSALEFEWAWQHPDKSAYLKGSEGSKKGAGIKNRVRSLESLLVSDYFKAFNLRVNSLIDLNYENTTILRELKEYEPDTGISLSGAFCLICEAKIENDNPNLCKCYGCDTFYHIKCMAEYSLQGDSTRLIPEKAVCLSCNLESNWEDIWV